MVEKTHDHKPLMIFFYLNKPKNSADFKLLLNQRDVILNVIRMCIDASQKDKPALSLLVKW